MRNYPIARWGGWVLLLAVVLLAPQAVGGDPSGIVFLKTHKTASSTVTALLHHLCVQRNVSCFVSPPPRPNIANRVHWDLREVRTLFALPLAQSHPSHERPLFVSRVHLFLPFLSLEAQEKNKLLLFSSFLPPHT